MSASQSAAQAQSENPLLALRPPSFCSLGYPLLYRRRSDRRKRTRALHGGPPADIGDTGSGPVPPAAPSSVAGLASVWPTVYSYICHQRCVGGHITSVEGIRGGRRYHF